MFDMGSERIGDLSPAPREQVEAATVELYDYIFGSLSGRAHQKQGVAFAYIARLMLEIPDATIQTLRQLMEDKAPRSTRARSYSDREARRHGAAFFETNYFTKAFRPHQAADRRRLYGFLPTRLRAHVLAPQEARHVRGDELGCDRAGQHVEGVLKSEASAIFGRYMIALAMQAALERAAIPPEQRGRHSSIIDEAADYFDSNIDTLLIQARKYKSALVSRINIWTSSTVGCARRSPPTRPSSSPAACQTRTLVP